MAEKKKLPQQINKLQLHLQIKKSNSVQNVYLQRNKQKAVFPLIQKKKKNCNSFHSFKLENNA